MKRPSITKAALFGLLLGICALAAGWSAASDTSAQEHTTETARNPLERATWSKETLVGDIHEVVQVKHYTYLRLGAEPEARWVVVMNEQHQPGDRVEASLFAYIDNFRSRALGRSFARLHFGVIDGPAPLARLRRAGNNKPQGVQP